jgi:hypothetical protein
MNLHSRCASFRSLSFSASLSPSLSVSLSYLSLSFYVYLYLSFPYLSVNLSLSPPCRFSTCLSNSILKQNKDSSIQYSMLVVYRDTDQAAPSDFLYFLYTTLNLYICVYWIYICHPTYLFVYSNLFLSKCIHACLSFVCAISICIICYICLFLSQEENPAKIEKPRRRKTAGMKPKSEIGTGEERWAGQGSEVTLGEQYLLASLQGQQNKLNLSSVGGFRLPQSYFSHR